MKKILHIIFSAAVICGYFPIRAQNIVVDSIPKRSSVAFATKAFVGGYFFPAEFAGYPGPAAGLSASLFVGRFEIEAGACYYHKFDQALPKNSPAAYRSVFHQQDYMSGYILTNIKIVQIKKNVFSGYLGVSFRKNLGWNTDTLLNDGAHRKNDQVTTAAPKTVGISLLGGVRYIHFFTPRICLVTGLDLAENIYNEFHLPGGTYTPTEMKAYPLPPEPQFQLGFSVGIQFVLAGRASGFYKEK
jgi:hypothetical protein